MARFIGMKKLGILLLWLDGMLVHRSVNFSILYGFPNGRRYPFKHVGGERQCGVKLLGL